MKDRIIIGSRGSKLALWQAEWTLARLRELQPSASVSIEIIKTTGDESSAPLTVIGGKGVFTKELEKALLEKRIDLAVHSLKDLPTVLSDSLTLAAITKREDPRDALVLRADLSLENPSIRGLPQGCVIGTSSQRRLAQLLSQRSDLEIKDLRGNIDTRLRKLDNGDYDAIMLASAGLRRLGLADRISAPLDVEEMVPAVGQAALGIETRDDDEALINVLSSLDDSSSRAACTAERAFLRALGGGCELPIAAYAEVAYGEMRMRGLVASRSGETIIRDEISGAPSEAQQLGNDLAEKLRLRGAEAILAS